MNSVNCIHAEEVGKDCCVKCKLTLFGGFPPRDICNNLCPQRKSKSEQPIPEPIPEIIKVEPVVEVSRFDSCKHRSPSEMERIIKTCCSSRVERGYNCQLLGIFPLQRERCTSCDKYEAKV
jgi:hypothetical protein